MNLSIQLQREDSMPAFGAFLRYDQPQPFHTILLNVEAVMHPEYEDGPVDDWTNEDRKRIIITTLMHEFGHALEAHFNIPDCEQAIENACMEWDNAKNSLAQPIESI